MKRRIFAILLALCLLSGCADGSRAAQADILATTAPMAQIAGAVTAGSGLSLIHI